MKNQKGFILTIVIILLITIGIGAVSTAGYVIYKQYNISKEQPQEQERSPSETESDTTKTNATEISGWKTHRSEDYGFEIKYPADATNIRVFPISLIKNATIVAPILSIENIQDMVSFTIFLNDDPACDIDHFYTEEQISSFGGKLISRSVVKINDTKFNKVVYDQTINNKSVRLWNYFILHLQKGFEGDVGLACLQLVFLSPQSTDYQEREVLFNQMLSTYRDFQGEKIIK